MYTSKMTVEEIKREYNNDLGYLLEASDREFIRNKKFFLKEALSKHKKCKSFIFFVKRYKCPKSKNIYFTTYSYNSRRGFLTHYSGVFTDDNGKRLLISVEKSIDTKGNIDDYLIVYTSHFLSRYRERLLNNSDISFDDLVKIFLSNEREGRELSHVSNELIRKSKPNEESFTLKTPNGCCFGTRSGSVIIFRTFITDDMLKESQSNTLNNIEEEIKSSRDMKQLENILLQVKERQKI